MPLSGTGSFDNTHEAGTFPASVSIPLANEGQTMTKKDFNAVAANAFNTTSEAFSVDNYLTKKGDAMKPQIIANYPDRHFRAGKLDLRTLVWVLQHPEEAKATMMKAVELANDPKELAKAKAAKAQGKTLTTTAPSEDSLAAQLSSL